jgi:succinate dehydrogenase / fumarate reductase membrane anchor subunit
MSKSARTMRTPLGQVRSLGASGKGTDHFIAMRVTSIALAVLAPWFTISAALALRSGEYASVIDFLTQPLNAVGVVLLVIAGLHHMAQGLEEVILDYIHKPSSKMALLLLNTFAAWLLGAGAVYSVLAINFGV